MTKIQGFTSVFEIGFASNLLFVLLEATPLIEESINKHLKRLQEIAKRKIEVTGSTEIFPIGLVINSEYGMYRFILLTLSGIMSMVSLGFLIYSGYAPDAEINPYALGVILFLILFITPIAVLVAHKLLKKLLTVAESHMQSQREKKLDENIQHKNNEMKDKISKKE